MKRIILCLMMLGCVGGLEDDPNLGTETEADIGDQPPAPTCAQTCSCQPSPIIIDLTEGNTLGFPEFFVYPPAPAVWNHTYNGFTMSTVAQGVFFDINNNGTKPQLSWPTGWSVVTEAWLALDVDGDRVIDSGAELFGTASIQVLQAGGYANGFKALAIYDKNHDGKIDASDPVWPHLLLWRDYNRDGKSTPDELIRVKDYETPGYPKTTAGGTVYHDKIIALGTGYSSVNHYMDPIGNNFWFRAPVTWTNDVNLFRGQFHHNPYAWDVFLASSSTPVGKVNVCTGTGIPGGGGGGGGGGSAGGGGGTTTPPAEVVNWPDATGTDTNDPFATDSQGRRWSDGPFPTATCAMDVFIIPDNGSPDSALLIPKGIAPGQICRGEIDAVTLKRCNIDLVPGSGSCNIIQPGPVTSAGGMGSGSFVNAIRVYATSQPGAFDPTIGFPTPEAMFQWLISFEWTNINLREFARQRFLSAEWGAIGLNKYCKLSNNHGIPSDNPKTTPVFYNYPGCRWIYDYPAFEDERAGEFWRTDPHGFQIPGYGPGFDFVRNWDPGSEDGFW